MNSDQSESQSQFECTVAFPNANVYGLPAIARALDRQGAVVGIETDELPGLVIGIRDAVELDLRLPPNAIFGTRTMNCLGRVIGISTDIIGELWFAVRFHSLQFREAAEQPGEQAVRSRIHNARQ